MKIKTLPFVNNDLKVKEIEKLFKRTIMHAYRDCIKNSEVVGKVVGKIVNDWAKTKAWKESEYILNPKTEIDKNKNIKLIMMLFISNRIIKDSQKGIDIIKKYGISNNTLTNLLFKI